MTMKNSEYKVILENYRYNWCDSCGGSGFKNSTFQGREFTDKCFSCKGTGKKKITHRTEVPLQDALNNLKTKNENHAR